MDKCDSDNILTQIDLDDADILIMDSSDSESESDGTRSKNLDIAKDTVNNDSSAEIANNEKSQANNLVLSLQCLHDDSGDELSNEKPKEDVEHLQLIPVKIVAINGFSGGTGSEVSHLQSSIPARNNWEGAHNFKIKFPCNDLSKRSENTIYSEMTQKLYVAKDHPFKVLVYAENVPKGSVIKVTAVFAVVEHSYEVVQRCPTHAQADFSKGNPAYEHFVQCYSETAVYTKNPDTGKLSLFVPYEKPQEGEMFTTYLFKLTCFSSCSGGINRRPFMLVFTLEKDNIPLGRQTLEAKVCACPVRDYKLEQERGHRKKFKTDTDIKISTGEQTVKSKYTISVKDPEEYLFLKQMKCLYEMCALSKVKQET